MTADEPRSLVIVNTGDGKGKSSSAFGMMGRAWAAGWSVAVVQFIKGEKWKTGERKLADHLGVEWHTMGDGFTWESTDMDETEAKARSAWQLAQQLIASERYDLVILDEVTYPITFGWIALDDALATIDSRPSRTHLVLTGRQAAQELVEVADTVSEVRSVKHAFDAGILAKKGLDY